MPLEEMQERKKGAHEEVFACSQKGKLDLKLARKHKQNNVPSNSTSKHTKVCMRAIQLQYQKNEVNGITNEEEVDIY